MARSALRRRLSRRDLPPPKREEDWTTSPDEEEILLREKYAERPLSEREMQILKLVAEGNTNAQIGAMIHLAEETIKSHVRRILGKLQARNRAHAVSIGYQRGWLTTGSPKE